MTNDVKINNSAVAAPKRKRRKIVSLDRRKARAGWIFVLPFIIGFVVIYLPLIYQSVQISFSEIWMGNDTYGMNFVGFKNYYDALFTDPGYVQTLLSGLASLAFDIPAILIFSLFMAIMLNQNMAGRAVFRSIFFIPVILSTGIMESVAAMDSLNTYMDSAEGIEDGAQAGANSGDLVSAMDLQVLFSSMKIGQELVIYITSIINNIYGIVNRSGVQMLIFLAGLQSISPAIYESCKIDGATAWETFWKITFPMISPMILVNGVYTVIDSFTTESNPVMVYVQKVYAEGNDEMSTAMSWMYFLIVMILVALIAAIFSAFVFYQRKND